jgi:hypothetical protein
MSDGRFEISGIQDGYECQAAFLAGTIQTYYAGMRLMEEADDKPPNGNATKSDATDPNCTCCCVEPEPSVKPGVCPEPEPYKKHSSWYDQA